MKEVEIKQELTNHNIGICLLIETKRKSKERMLHIQTNIRITWMTLKYLNERIMRIIIEFNGKTSTNILAIYTPDTGRGRRRDHF